MLNIHVVQRSTGLCGSTRTKSGFSYVFSTLGPPELDWTVPEMFSLLYNLLCEYYFRTTVGIIHVQDNTCSLIGTITYAISYWEMQMCTVVCQHTAHSHMPVTQISNYFLKLGILLCVRICVSIVLANRFNTFVV